MRFSIIDMQPPDSGSISQDKGLHGGPGIDPHTTYPFCSIHKDHDSISQAEGSCCLIREIHVTYTEQDKTLSLTSHKVLLETSPF